MAAKRRKSWSLEDEARPFYEMMGMCIASWADVDEELFAIFHRCMGAPEPQCAIAYFKTPSLEARRTLTEEVVLSVLPKKKPGQHDHASVRAWNAAVEDFQDLLRTRGKIAHHKMRLVMEGGPRGRKTWFQLYMNYSEQQCGRNASAILKDADLQHHLDSTTALERRLYAFRRDVLPMHVGEPPDKLHEPETDAQRSRHRSK